MGAGALTALWYAREQRDWHAALEIAGGALAGGLASRLPDVVDPPTNPNNRDIAHGLITAVIIGLLIVRASDECREWLRAKADSLANARAAIDDPFDKTLNLLLEVLFRLTAGATIGMVAGYGSHLALDLTTARGLPLVCRGF